MKFTLKWLKEYLITSEAPEKIASTLSSMGLEVELCENMGTRYKGFCVAEIESAIAHPNADKLKVCVVNNGTQKLQVVCGANNVRAGIKVVLANVGAVVPLNQVQIKKSNIRSVESNGMLCSAFELMLEEEDSDGIMELPKSADLGQDFASYLGVDDVLLEVALTPNKGDCTSVYGIARELSAAGIGTLRSISPPNLRLSEKISQFYTEIEDQENVVEFSLQYISDISNHKKQGNSFLKAIGYSLKNSVVDASNFMMLSLGRPNHAYDADKINGKIRVRLSKDNEKFIALGGTEYKLPQGLTVIADDVKVLAVAGVIGGELSKVDNDTKNILLEVANFKSDAVAKAGRALNIATDSRFRFEREVDEGNTDLFARCLAQEIISECGGTPYEPLIWKGKQNKYVRSIYFDYEKLICIIGTNISKEHCIEILSRLGFFIKDSSITIPSWRLGNITVIEDIAEEIIRIYGVDKIPSKSLPASNSFDIAALSENTDSIREQKYRSTLFARQLNEVITWSFINEKFCDMFGFCDYIQLENPISEDMKAMRPTLLVGMLTAIQKNITRDFSSLSMFERGNIYKLQDNKVTEESMIGVVRAGFTGPKSVHEKQRTWDFYDVKGDFLAIVESTGLNPKSIFLSRNAPSYYHPTKSALFAVGNKILGYCGQLHPKIIQGLDLKIPIMCLEIFDKNIPAVKNKFSPPILSDYQAVSRDFAFLVDTAVYASEIIKAIDGLKEPLIKNVELFDLYEGAGLPIGKKSVAINVKLQSDQKTLIDQEIEKISENIVAKVLEKTGGVIRV